MTAMWINSKSDTGFCDGIERACFAGVFGATAAALRRAQTPPRVSINVHLRLLPRDNWRPGPDAIPLHATARPAETERHLEEDPERWDGLS